MSTQSSNSSVSRPKEIPFDTAALDILNSLGLGLIIVDLDRCIRFRNSLAENWLPEASKLEVVFAEAKFLGPFEGWKKQLEPLQDSSQSVILRCVIAWPGQSSPELVDIRCTPIVEKSTGQRTGYVLLLDKRNQVEALEDQIEVSKRLESLGKLATRVAHELNNPLDGILRYINLSIRVLGDTNEPKLKNYLDESRTGLMRMMQIIGDLLEFSRSTDGEFDELDVNEVIDQAIRTNASRADASKVIVTADFQQQDMPSVRGSRLYQVCSNLIRNAIDAMPEGGRLSVTSGVVTHQVVIRVADTGVGLPQDVSKLFEPFFTSKEAGKGTGLGLAICKEFIEDMGGTIEATSGKESGAVFTVKIPVDRCQTTKRFTKGVISSQDNK